MEQEEKDYSLSSESGLRKEVSNRDTQVKRTPIASANGSELAKLNDNNVGRRKRVRISADINNSPRSYFDNNMPKQSSYRQQRMDYENTYNNFDNADSAYTHYERATINRAYNNEHNRTNRYSNNQSSFNNRNRTNNRQNTSNRPNSRVNSNVNSNYNRVNNANPNARPQNAKRPNNNFKQKVAKPTTKKKVIQKAEATPAPTPIKFRELLPADMEIRLNKYISSSGICSRREADIMIENGDVTVNGVVVKELGVRVRPIDVVEVKGKQISFESKVYILLNKPKNVVTTVDDPEGRTTVMDIIKGATSERIYPVGRLDRNTMGVLLLTNDGELASKLTHPSYMKKKIYHVWLHKEILPEDMQKIADGIELEDGEIHADAISYVKEDDQKQVGIEIHSGRNRIVRRIFEHLGYRVVKLDRVYFAGLTKKNLPRGKWRFLDEREVMNLRMGSFE